jgi:hypothetical protein
VEIYDWQAVSDANSDSPISFCLLFAKFRNSKIRRTILCVSIRAVTCPPVKNVPWVSLLSRDSKKSSRRSFENSNSPSRFVNLAPATRNHQSLTILTMRARRQQATRRQTRIRHPTMLINKEKMKMKMLLLMQPTGQRQALPSSRPNVRAASLTWATKSNKPRAKS